MWFAGLVVSDRCRQEGRTYLFTLFNENKTLGIADDHSVPVVDPEQFPTPDMYRVIHKTESIIATSRILRNGGSGSCGTRPRQQEI